MNIFEQFGIAPGPWKVNEVSGYRIDQIYSGESKASPICEMIDCDMPERFFIAAIPEMWEACERLMMAFNDQENHQELFLAVAAAERAIEKATGKAWDQLKNTVPTE